MTLFTDKLPPTKTEPHSGFTLFLFTPDPCADFDHMVGTLLIESPKRRTEFGVSEFTVPHGRGFLLEKLCGAIGDESPMENRYAVTCDRDGRRASCECKGWRFGKGRDCRHIAAVRGCIENQWL